MRAARRWAHMAPSTVTVAAQTGRDGQAKPTYGTAVTYRASRLIGKREVVRTAGGIEVESRQQLLILSPDLILPTAQVTLSTGDVGSTEASAIQPKVLTVVRRFDGVGSHHSVVFF